MNKLKGMLAIVLIAVLGVVTFISCEKEVTEQNPSTDVTHVDIKKTSYAGSVFFKNLQLVQDEYGKVEKYTDGVFNYNIVNEQEYTSEIKKNDDTGEEELILTNVVSREFFTVFNIVKHEHHTAFDVKTSKGEVLKGLVLKVHEGTNKSTKVAPILPILWLAKEVIDLVVEVVNGSDLQQCQQALAAITPCPDGKAPYMEFTEGWLSTSCKVGCK